MRAAESAQPIRQGISTAVRPRFTCAFLILFLTLPFALSSCTQQRPVEEVVTTDAGRTSALPPGAEAIAREPRLPARDADIEAAGDLIAEAITHLNAKRREAALRALNQSEAALNRALMAHASDGQLTLSLRATLKDLDAAERAIQHGSQDAAKQLANINRNLDGLNLKQ